MFVHGFNVSRAFAVQPIFQRRHAVFHKNWHTVFPRWPVRTAEKFTSAPGQFQRVLERLAAYFLPQVNEWH